MHHSLRVKENAPEKLLRELQKFAPFRGKRGSSLFLEAFCWYFYAKKKSQPPSLLVSASSEAHALYQQRGMLPEFFWKIPKLCRKEETLRDAPSQGRHISSDDSHLRQVLLNVSAATPAFVYLPYAPEHAPLFWHSVFVEYFGTEPQGDEDPLWDSLFQAGMPLLRKLKTASL